MLQIAKHVDIASKTYVQARKYGEVSDEHRKELYAFIKEWSKKVDDANRENNKKIG